MIKAVLTDIEGTTSSISFVHDVLFPYAREHLPAYVRTHLDDPQLKSILDAVGEQAARTLSTDEAIARLLQWIDEDRKITPLKALQGLIWENGYRRGDFFGDVYADTVAAFREWHAQRNTDLYLLFRLGLRTEAAVCPHPARRSHRPVIRLF